MNTTIPFYRNTPDNTHCFQACVKMIAKYFWPKEEYSWKELDKATGKVKGLWSWIMAGSIWLQKKGVEVIDIETFDYERFVKEKESYLINFYGEKAGKEQIEHSDISTEFNNAKKFRKKISIQNRIPDKDEIKNLLLKSYLVVCLINQKELNNKSGYIGHFVLVKGFDKEGFFLHDPGLPAYENRKVSYELFEKAWAYPDEKVKNILAFRLRDYKD